MMQRIQCIEYSANKTIYSTTISGPYGPFILAPAEGTIVLTQGLASLTDPVIVNFWQFYEKLAVHAGLG